MNRFETENQKLKSENDRVSQENKSSKMKIEELRKNIEKLEGKLNQCQNDKLALKKDLESIPLLETKSIRIGNAGSFFGGEVTIKIEEEMRKCPSDHYLFTIKIRNQSEPLNLCLEIADDKTFSNKGNKYYLKFLGREYRQLTPDTSAGAIYIPGTSAHFFEVELGKLK